MAYGTRPLLFRARRGFICSQQIVADGTVSNRRHVAVEKCRVHAAGMSRDRTGIAHGIIRHVARHAEIGAARARNFRPVVRVRCVGIVERRRVGEHDGLARLADGIFPRTVIDRAGKSRLRLDLPVFGIRFHPQAKTVSGADRSAISADGGLREGRTTQRLLGRAEAVEPQFIRPPEKIGILNDKGGGIIAPVSAPTPLAGSERQPCSRRCHPDTFWWQAATAFHC